MQAHTQGLALPRRRRNPGIRTAAMLCLLLLLFMGSSKAQVSTASVNGVVSDPQGAVIPGATIVLRNLDTSVEHSSISNNAGNYVILDITPGRYTIQASAKGFTQEKTDEFVLAVAQTATFNFALKVGSETQVVTCPVLRCRAIGCYGCLSRHCDRQPAGRCHASERPQLHFTACAHPRRRAHHGGAECGNE